MKEEDIMHVLEKVALSTEKVANARVAAALVFRNDIISIGTNKKKSHPFQKRFRKNKNAIFLHAEIDAIKNALKVHPLHIIERSKLYVCRMKQHPHTKEYQYGLVKPCIGCISAIEAFGIRDVKYTCDSGELECL